MDTKKNCKLHIRKLEEENRQLKEALKATKADIGRVVYLMRDAAGYFVLCDGTIGEGVPLASEFVSFQLGRFYAEKDHEDKKQS